MDNIINLVGNLILLFSGFVISIVTISTSIFSEGVKILREKYQNEKHQTIKNIKDQMEKDGDNLDIDRTLEELRKREIDNNKNLRYLSLEGILLWNSVPMMVSFLSLITVSIIYGYDFVYKFWILTLVWFVIFICFCIGVYHFYQSIKIIIEASVVKDGNEKSKQETVSALLTNIVENTRKDNAPSTFVKNENIKIAINNEKIDNNSVLTFSVNKKHDIKIKLLNLDDLMLKESELGFTLPTEFLIEREQNDRISSIFTGETNQIVRFNNKHIHSHESNNLGKICVKFLKIGEFHIKSFVKGENLIQKNITFKIKVIE